MRIWEHPYLEDTPDSLRMKRLNKLFHILAFLAAFASLVLFLVGRRAHAIPLRKD